MCMMHENVVRNVTPQSAPVAHIATAKVAHMPSTPTRLCATQYITEVCAKIHC